VLVSVSVRSNVLEGVATREGEGEKEKGKKKPPRETGPGYERTYNQKSIGCLQKRDGSIFGFIEGRGGGKERKRKKGGEGGAE